MKSSAKKLAVCAVLLGLLCTMATPVLAAAPHYEEENGLTLPWDTTIAADSIEPGNYSAKMILGSTQQLAPVVRPSYSTESVVFISDDTSVLTVTSTGIVQAVGVGTASITAAAGNKICSYTIVVSLDSSMIVTAMDLALASNTIYVGDSVSASLQVMPSSAANYATVTLTSSNEKVATVNEFGRVTGVSAGTATITATCGSVTASAKITVKATSTSVNSGQVVVPSTTYVVLKPGATRTLTAKATPASASQSFTYKSGNSSIATVSPSGVITAVGTGSTSITVSNGTASALVTVIVNRSAPSVEQGGEVGDGTAQDSIALDPVVQTIQNSTEDDVVFAQEELPVVTSEILNSLRTTGKTLCVVGDGYILKIPGKSVKSTTSQLDTMLTFTTTEHGLEFVLDNGRSLPCTVLVELDVSTYSRLYLYNSTSEKWQYLNSYTDGVITADTAGRYLLTNQNLNFADINYTFFIAGGAVVVLIAAAYIVLKKRYWFW